MPDARWQRCRTHYAANLISVTHDEWVEQRRYLGLGALKNARAVLAARTTDNQPEEVGHGLIAGVIHT